VNSYMSDSAWAGDYFGDYIYNSNMGVLKYTSGLQYFTSPEPRLNQVPGNVMLLTESIKPNFFAGTTNKHLSTSGGEIGQPVGYKDYFGAWENLVNNPATDTGETGPLNRIGTPHSGSKMCNCLSADGHVSLINPYTQSLVPTNTTGPSGFSASTNTYTYVGGQTPYVYALGKNAYFMDYMIGPPNTSQLQEITAGTPVSGPTYWTPPNGNPYNQGWNKGLPSLP
jgi:prepilin-type processing-associated H-X9-DG protein